MIIGNKDTAKNVFIVAEIGNNHEGHLGRAKQMIKEAARCGVDAVKFQTFKTENYIFPSDKDRFNRLKSFELSFPDFKELHDLAKKEGLIFLSTPLDLESAKFLKQLVPAFKIASGDNNFYALLDAVSESGKPLILSSGLVDMDHLHKIKNRIEKCWKEKNLTPEMAILHCVTSYPVPAEQANLNAILDLQKEFSCTIGYSDHTLGIEASLAAVALGAQIIEKHFTLDKNLSDFRDHKMSADPTELKNLVQMIRNLSRMKGTGRKIIQECEKGFLLGTRRKAVAQHDLEEGRLLNREDLLWLRLSDGLTPEEEEQILGHPLNRTVKKGEPIKLEFIS